MYMDCCNDIRVALTCRQDCTPNSFQGIRISWWEVCFANEIYFLPASSEVMDREDSMEYRPRLPDSRFPLQSQFSVTSADGLYIVPYEAKVVKKVAQLGDNGNPLQKFSVSNKQRYVDYVINGSLKYWNNVEPEKDTTTVYFEDTLPKGLTYIEGSAYWGGQYQSKFPNQGIVKNGQFSKLLYKMGLYQIYIIHVKLEMKFIQKTMLQIMKH